ncbi:MAG: DUF1611 domain-containing protein [Pseudomonadota bacterium]
MTATAGKDLQTMTDSLPLDPAALGAAKWAFTTRRVARDDARRLVPRPQAARSGDLVLARVERIGRHEKVQLPSGRYARLYPGDLIVMPCGARYATDQFEGVAEIDPEGADMLAGGGVLGRVRRRHARMGQPTRVAPLGLLADAQGATLDLARYALPPARNRPAIPAIAVLGAAMNAGKTTAAAALAHGLSRGGRRVSVLKATGTGAAGDLNAYRDASAAHVADFTDAGMASTWLQPLERIARGLDALLADAAAQGCDVALIEFADGVLQAETAGLLRRRDLRESLAGAIFAAPDALAAVGGAEALAALGLRPAALTGMLSRSPLATAEAEAAAGLPVLTRETLCDPAAAGALVERILAAARPSPQPARAAPAAAEPAA